MRNHEGPRTHHVRMIADGVNWWVLHAWSCMQVLVIKRAKEPGKGMWSFPGGGLELGEGRFEVK